MERRLLVVDDDAQVTALLADALAKRGFTVDIATDGPTCLEAVQEQMPDAVILDLKMPGMDGLAVLRKLRAQPETRLLPIIILTGRREHWALLQSWLGGADRCLTKPCTIQDLVQTVGTVLGEPASH